MRYLISYDLRSLGGNYDPLWEVLTLLDARRVLQSQYVTSREETSAAELAEVIWSVMDSNDGLLVTSLESNEWAAYGLEIGIESI